MSDNQIKYLLRTGILRGIPTTAQKTDPQNGDPQKNQQVKKQKEKKQKTQRTKKAKTKTAQKTKNTKAWKEFRKRFAWVNELLEKSEREKL